MFVPRDDDEDPAEEALVLLLVSVLVSMIFVDNFLMRLKKSKQSVGGAGQLVVFFAPVRRKKSLGAWCLD